MEIRSRAQKTFVASELGFFLQPFGECPKILVSREAILARSVSQMTNCMSLIALKMAIAIGSWPSQDANNCKFILFSAPRALVISVEKTIFDLQHKIIIHIWIFFLISELQQLMGTLLFVQHGLENSPYAYLLDSIHWLEICDVFTRDACALLGLSVESPLSVA